ncbi:MAG TPA: hypothetical protein PLU50_04075, partial [Pseudobdellovibrionaceae bacterium]|nr:hypothetical protein [Pseudobdellovibrionaceae bacterium]
ARSQSQNASQAYEQIEIAINSFENVVLYNFPLCVSNQNGCDRSRLMISSRSKKMNKPPSSENIPKYYRTIQFAVASHAQTLNIHTETELMEAIENRFMALTLDSQFKSWKAANFAPEKLPTDKYLSQASSIIYQLNEIYNMGRVDQYLGCPSESFCKKFVNLAKKYGLYQDSQKFLSRSISTMRALKISSFKKIWIRHLENVDRDGIQRIKTWIQWMTRVGSDPVYVNADQATEEGIKIYNDWLSTSRYQYWEEFPLRTDPEPMIGTPLPLSPDEERDLASALSDLKINLPNLYPRFASTPSYTKPKEHKGFIVNFLSKPSPTESDDRKPFFISESLCDNLTFDTGNTIVQSKDCRRNYDERMSEYVAKRYGSISKSETSKFSKQLMDGLVNKNSKILKRDD